MSRMPVGRERPFLTQPLRMAWWALVNALLLPLYLVFFAVACFVAISPLTPARTARDNLQKHLGLTPLKALWVTALTLFNYGLVAAELLILNPLGAMLRSNEDEALTFVGSVVEAYGLAESGRGLLFLGAHFAAMEEVGGVLNAYWLPFRGQGVTAVAKPASFRLGTWLMDFYRRKRGFGVIWTGRSEKVRESMRELLVTGGALGLVVDQKARKEGLFLRFFSEWASFPYGGVELAQGLKVPCIAMNVRRRVLPGLFRVEYALLSPSVDPVALEAHGVVDLAAYQRALSQNSFAYEASESFENALSGESHAEKGPQESTRQLMQHYAGWVEALVKKSPYQWCWDYRKWSRKPQCAKDGALQAKA